MAQPKDTYTFSSSREDCDYLRIMNENRTSNVIVLSRKKSESPTITLVRANAYRELSRLAEAGISGVAHVCAGPFGSQPLAEVFIGDVHVAALGIVETKVEAY